MPQSMWTSSQTAAMSTSKRQLKLRKHWKARLHLRSLHYLIESRLSTIMLTIVSLEHIPWSTIARSKDKTSSNREEATSPTRPGQVVSVDQMVSPTPGLIAQLTGKLTTKRYKYATIYVDQFTDCSYVHLQKTAGAEETLEGKIAFEKFASSHGVKIEHYHADNGIFRAHTWVHHCKVQGQGLSFAGVNAHHQNGKAERRIRTLQESACTMLIHAKRRWPRAIEANLWPYALHMSNDAHNHLPSKNGKTPIQQFANTDASTNPKHWMPFGCPAYVLNRQLQSSTPIFHKWKDRVKLSLYLERSPHHYQNIALVLDFKTGLVSPQLHVK